MIVFPKIAEDEEWRSVEGTKYWISNHGRIFSFYIKKDGVLIKPALANGYPCITRTAIYYKKAYIHRWIAIAFIPNPLSLKCVNHIDGVKTNNHVSNLEWISYKGNAVHALLTGLMNKKLNRDDVIEIRRLLSEGVPRKEITKKFNISLCTLSHIHVGRQYGDFK